MPESLAWGVGETVPGTIFVQSVTGRITFGPGEGRTLLFGRGDPDVHVCVGETDRGVSRRHGELFYRGGRWWLSNTGTRPIRVAARLVSPGEAPILLDGGYTPLFVQGTGGREHLLEVYVVGLEGHVPAARHHDPTQPPRVWRLSPDERLALVALGQRYLRHEPDPQPLTRRDTARLLAEARPDDHWTVKRVEHLVNDVRQRLSKGGVSGLTEKEVGTPVGNALNHNLLRELIRSTTLVPLDLAEFDAMFDFD
jgi:hypothetical protein